MPRKATVKRKTKETDIEISLNLEGGEINIDTPIPFFSHMLNAFAKHGGFGLNCKVRGDIEVDFHHSIEDTGLALGQCLKDALGDKKGINRYGFFQVPFDETLIECSIDLSGRFYLVYNLSLKNGELGNVDPDLFQDFFYALAEEGRFNLHLNQRYGRSNHHIIEACFKGLGRALRAAINPNPYIKGIPSTKGSL